jgi:hypothetical protein
MDPAMRRIGLVLTGATIAAYGAAAVGWLAARVLFQVS